MWAVWGSSYDLGLDSPHSNRGGLGSDDPHQPTEMAREDAREQAQEGMPSTYLCQSP